MVTPYYADDSVTLYHGDCIEVLRELPDSSVDSIVTDPPYGLEFMGKDWDAPWREADVNADAGMSSLGYTDGGERLPRPSFTGSTNPKCLVCKGTRRGRRDGTAKVAVCLCEDGGRFPNVRAIEMRAFAEWCEEWAIECLRVLKPGGHLLAFGGTRTWHRLACAVEDAGFEIRDSIAWLYGSGFPKSLDVSKAITGTQLGHGGNSGAIRRATMGEEYTPSGVRGNRDGVTRRSDSDTGMADRDTGMADRDLALTPDAAQWQGWGTALKPAFEPIVVARKPLAGTVAANVLEHGTGALNIDGCRIATDEDRSRPPRTPNAILGNGKGTNLAASESNPGGRWPANVILDGHTAELLDQQSGELTSGLYKPSHADGGKSPGVYGAMSGREREAPTYGDSGGASRFFPTFRYEAKAPTSERPRVDGIAHPTVKPLDLMRWLVRLVTPPGGTVLEPFAGSGTTAEACVIEGFKCIAVERDADYLPLIIQRLSKPIQVGLDFGSAS